MLHFKLLCYNYNLGKLREIISFLRSMVAFLCKNLDYKPQSINHNFRFYIFHLMCKLQYCSASLSINPASRAGACTDCEYIECTIAIIIIVILVQSLFLVY